MLKKILILPVGFLLTTILYISCCKCLDSNDPFYEATRITVDPRGSGGVLVDNGTPVTSDTVFLNCFLTVNCVAETKTDLSFLVNSAYACSCRGCGEQGLKSKLLSIEVTSDNTFNGIAADNSLNSFFKVKGDNINVPDYSIDSLITLFNGPGNLRAGFFLFTKIKPGNTLSHKFKINMVFTNNTVLTVVTHPIVWQ
ncbi:MAG: hypothetical protein ABIO79_14465 [Ferruginibacter sp.]